MPFTVDEPDCEFLLFISIDEDLWAGVKFLDLSK